MCIYTFTCRLYLQSKQFMECCSSTIIGVAYKYCSSAKTVDCCLPAWSQLLLLASNLLAQVPQGEFCTYCDICVYIHLLVVYTYTLTTNFFVFTFQWMKAITARLSTKFRQALPTNNLCTLYTTFQNPGWEPAILNQTVMHNCYKHCWNSWYACMRLCFYRLPHPA